MAVGQRARERAVVREQLVDHVHACTLEVAPARRDYQLAELPVVAGQPLCVAPTVVQVREIAPFAARLTLNVSSVAGAVAVRV